MTESDELCTTGHERGVIELLLEEYKALRSEINQRVAERVRLTAAAGAIALILTATGNFPVGRHLYTAAALVAFVTIWALWGLRRTIELGAHLARLEDRINALSMRAYGAPNVFTWEHWMAAKRRRRTERWRWLLRRH